MPQSVTPIPDAPHPAPRILRESIPPELLAPVLHLYRQGSADQGAKPPCHCRIELKIPLIEEDDPTVTLEARWFVDYDPQVRAAIVWTDPRPGDFNNPGTTRSLTTQYFDADALGISSNGIHVVTVVLAEQAGFDNNSPILRNRAMLPGYSRDEQSFVIDVRWDPDPARPSCVRDAPPSYPVCQ